MTLMSISGSLVLMVENTTEGHCAHGLTDSEYGCKIRLSILPRMDMPMASFGSLPHFPELTRNRRRDLNLSQLTTFMSITATDEGS